MPGYISLKISFFSSQSHQKRVYAISEWFKLMIREKCHGKMLKTFSPSAAVRWQSAIECKQWVYNCAESEIAYW